MTPHWLDTSFVYALGWTLLHTLWQVTLIALIIRLLWAPISQRRARLRYGLGLFAMCMGLAGAVVTFGYYFEKEHSALSEQPEWVFSNASLSAEAELLGEELVLEDLWAPAPEEEVLSGLQATIERYLPWLVLAWLLGTMVMGLRLVGGWFHLHRVSRQGLGSLPSEWAERFSRLTEKMDVRRPVQWHLSSLVEEPITLKHFKPLILFPVGLINELTVAEVEVILLHELAHIRRWDYLINWFQSILELLFFYHPAVWWLSGEVRKAREHCCDDLVLQRGGARRMLYAQTLTRLTAISFTQQTKLAMSVKGINGSFTQRVKRLFGHHEPAQDWRKPVLSIFVCVAILFGFGLSSQAGEDSISNHDSELGLEEENAFEIIENDSFELKPFVRVNGFEIAFSKTSAPFNLINLYEKEEKEESENGATSFTAGEVTYNPELKRVTASARSMVLKLKEPGLEVWMNGQFWGTKLEKLEEIDAESLETVVLNQQENRLYVYSKGHTPSHLQLSAETPLYQATALHLALSDTIPAAENSIRIHQDQLDISKAGGQIDWYRFPAKISLNGQKEEVAWMPVDRFSIDLSKKPTIILMDASYREIKDYRELEQLNAGRLAMIKSYPASDKGGRSRSGRIFLYTQRHLEAYPESKPALQLEPGDRVNNTSLSAPFQIRPLIVLNDESKGRDTSVISSIDPNTIKHINVLRHLSAMEKYGPEAEDGVIEIVTKDYQDKKSNNPAVENLATPKLSFEKSSRQHPLVVVDGVVLGRDTSIINEYEENNIDHVNVWKGASAVEKYGAEGADGVIEIHTKKDLTKSQETPKVIIRQEKKEASPENPLFVIDGEKMGPLDDQNIRELDPNDIDRINVLKDEKALEKYGQEGKDGVVEIFTKKAAKKNRRKRVPSEKPRLKPSPIQPGLDPLIVIDGEVIGRKDKAFINQIDPETIERVNVLKDQSALKKYGPEGDNGVIEIFLKPGAKKEKLQELVIDERSVLKEQIEASVFTYPTPFSNEVNIAFTLPRRAATKVSIFTLDGQLVTTLINEILEPAEYQLPWAAGNRNPGNYIVRIEAGEVVISRKLIKQ